MKIYRYTSDYGFNCAHFSEGTVINNSHIIRRMSELIDIST